MKENTKHNDMDNDFDIAYSKYMQSFVDLINNSGMPMSVTVSILDSIHSQTQAALQNKLQRYHQQAQEDESDEDETQ